MAVRPPADDGGAAVSKYELFAEVEEKAGAAAAAAAVADPASLKLVASGSC